MFAAFALAAALLAAVTGPWPEYRHDLNNTGAVAGPAHASSSIRLRPSWTFTADSRITSAATVVDGMAYVGAFSGAVYALDERTGRPIWHHDLGNNPAGIRAYGGPRGVLGSIAVRDGVAYADSGSCVAAAFDARSGRQLWRRSICNTQLLDDTYATPVVAGGLVLIGISMIDDKPDDRGREIALDAKTGALKWTLYPQRYSGTGAGITTTPAVDEQTGIGYLGTGNPTPVTSPPPGPDPGSDSMIAFRVATGHVLWTYGPVNPHDSYDLDFFASPNRFSIRDGDSARWLIGEPNKNGIYYALDARTGSVVWHTEVEPLSHWPLPMGTPAVGDGEIVVPVYVNDDTGFLVALRVADGAVIWRRNAGGMYEAPALFGDIIFVTEALGWLDAFRAEDGTSLGRWQVGGWLTGRGPSVADGRLFVATSQYLKVYDITP